MSFILIDRRNAGRGKSTSNRQKLIRRIRNFIKSSSPANIGKFGGVTGQSGNLPTGGSSPVKVAGKALEQPWFAYSSNDAFTAIFLGNTEYERGDKLNFPKQDSNSSTGGQQDNGEDDFLVPVARDEFLKYFYEDCELPNLTHERYTEKLENKYQRAGFSTTGSPPQLSILRTYKQALGRRRAMGTPYEEEKVQLEAELAALREKLDPNEAIPDEIGHRIDEIVARLVEIDRKLEFLLSFDSSDLRYRKREAQPLKTADAVIFFLMDISGSMDEQKKTIARRWFALAYGFIKRRYPSTELVFIAHTNEAFEMSEDDFFSTRINGGTSASTAIALANKIIKERYDPNQTNIYVLHASDGDNWLDDNELVMDEMVGKGNLMSKIQFFNYIEVGKQGGQGMYGLMGAAAESRDDSGLWKVYVDVRDRTADKKLICIIVEDPDSCYPAFKKVFKKRSTSGTPIHP